MLFVLVMSELGGKIDYTYNTPYDYNLEYMTSTPRALG